MSLADELAGLDAVGQAVIVSAGELEPERLVEAAIERLDRADPALNAVVARYDGAALEAARSCPSQAPFRGVPLLLKDLATELAGEPLTAGSAFLAGRYRPSADSDLVRAYKAAGFAVLGKTNVSEFGMLPTTEPALFGPTGNPWDFSRTAGGSSGGAAAAVAAGLVAVAHGNDGGGSLRVPAAACGVFGFKPTRGRTPWGPRYGDYVSGLASEHVITRSVRDSAAVLDVSHAADADPYRYPGPGGPFAAAVGRDPGRLRIAVALAPDDWGGEGEKSVEDAARLCRELGHSVAERPLSLKGARSIVTVQLAECAWQIEDWAAATGQRPEADRFEAITWELYERGRRVTAAAYLEAWRELQGMGRAAAASFDDVDVWLTPCIRREAPMLGWHRAAGSPWESFLEARRWVSPYVPFWSVAGNPAASVPLRRGPSGLPVGVQFACRLGEDERLLSLAAQLERARPWAAALPRPVRLPA